MITLTARITISDGTFDINYRNLLSFESGIIDRSDTILPSWGIISNGGRLTILDYDSTIRQWVEGLKINSKTKVNVYLNNTISGASTQVGDFFVSKCSYDNNNHTATIEITDGLQQLQEMNTIPLALDFSLEENENTMTALDIFRILRNQTVMKGFRMFSEISPTFDAETFTHLFNISIAYPYIEKMSLWKAWQDFATAFQLHIYKNSEGNIVCFYRGGD